MIQTVAKKKQPAPSQHEHTEHRYPRRRIATRVNVFVLTWRRLLWVHFCDRLKTHCRPLPTWKRFCRWSCCSLSRSTDREIGSRLPTGIDQPKSVPRSVRCVVFCRRAERDRLRSAIAKSSGSRDLDRDRDRRPTDRGIGDFKGPTCHRQGPACSEIPACGTARRRAPRGQRRSAPAAAGRRPAASPQFKARPALTPGRLLHRP